jgi:hypothetical protein
LLNPTEHPPPPPGAGARAAQSRPLDTIDRYLTPRVGAVPVQLIADGEPLTLSAVIDLSLGSSPPTDPFLEPNLGGTPAIDANAVAMRDALGLPVRTEYLCTTPCMLYLPPGRARLHIGGPGRLESIEAIDIGRAPQRVTLFSPSAAAFGGGVALTLLGASTALVGTMALIVDATSPTNASTSLATAGGIMLGLGGAALAVGIPLILRARTGVERTTRLPMRPNPAAHRDADSAARPRPRTPPLVGAGLAPVAHGQGFVAGLAFTF